MRTKSFCNLFLLLAVLIISGCAFAREDMTTGNKLDKIVRGRLLLDLAELEKLPGIEKQESLHRDIDNMPQVSAINWRRGVPYNGLHRSIWAKHAEWAKNKLTEADPLLVWTPNRWDHLQPFDLPTAEQLKAVSIDVKMIKGEYRSAVLNLTNLSDSSVKVNIECEFDKKLPDELLSVREVIFVETQDRKIVANALPPAAKQGDAWQLEVPSGATRQAWLIFHPKNIAAAKYIGTVKVECNALKLTRSVPLSLEVYPFDFPEKATLITTTWDYCQRDGGYIHNNVWKDAVALMKEHFINAPWLNPNMVPWPNPGTEIDEKGNIIAELDWSNMDEWVEIWGDDAKVFMIFFGEEAAVPRSEFELTSPEGQNAINNVIGQMVERFQSQGIDASRIIILPRDEPRTADKSRSVANWNKALHKANPKIRIYTDPIWKDPAKSPIELFTTADIICPNVHHFGGKEKITAFYRGIRAAGKELWTYQCDGPVKELDPYGYFRRQAWHAFRESMVGSGYWALSDSRHKAGSWDDFAPKGTMYSIIYWDKNGVTDSKQLEGIREGIEDYEYLVMLRKAIASATDSEKAAKAQAVLDRVVDEIGNNYGDVGKRLAADRARIEVLDALMLLSGK